MLNVYIDDINGSLISSGGLKRGRGLWATGGPLGLLAVLLYIRVCPKNSPSPLDDPRGKSIYFNAFFYSDKYVNSN